VNGDGLPDVVLSDGAVVSVLDNLGKRSFGAEQQVFAGGGITSLAVRDVNGDGAPDLIVSSEVANTGGIAVLLNTGRAKAKPAASTTMTTTTLALCVGGSSPNCPVNGIPSGITVVPSFSLTYGQVFNGIEGVTDTDGSAFTGMGTLTFYQDGVSLCVLSVNIFISCPATVGVGTTAGTHVFDSVYSGDATFEGSTSNLVTITVTQDSTVASGAGSPNPSPAGQPVKLTATLTGNDAPSTGPSGPPLGNYMPPSGMVVFLDGGTVIGHGTLAANASGVSSTATLITTALPVGTDSIMVTYVGDTDFGGTVSPVFTETIAPVVATTTTLNSSVNPSYSGQSVTFTATVTDGGRGDGSGADGDGDLLRWRHGDWHGDAECGGGCDVHDLDAGGGEPQHDGERERGWGDGAEQLGGTGAGGGCAAAAGVSELYDHGDAEPGERWRGRGGAADGDGDGAERLSRWGESELRACADRGCVPVSQCGDSSGRRFDHAGAGDDGAA
jgi:hypothetical protein